MLSAIASPVIMPSIAVALGLILLAYLMGSLPTGYLAGRLIGGFDIRERGSGSTGTTNVLRNLGKGPAVLVLLIDVLKGSAAVALVRALWQSWIVRGSGLLDPLGADWTGWLVALAALAAVLGHSAPVWLGFRGGKSVATGLGTLATMVWPVALGALLGFSLSLALSRIVSLSSMVAASLAILLPLVLGVPLPYQLYGLVGGIYVLWRHRSNASRLVAGTEPKLGQGSSSSRTSLPS